MKFNIGVCRVAVSGQHRGEIGDWLIEISTHYHSDPTFKEKVADIYHFTMSQCPTDVARNQALQLAKQHGIDILFMVDDDCVPPQGWFQRASEFLIDNSAVIACPYVSGGIGGIAQVVQVFQWQIAGNVDPPPHTLKQIAREDAARRTGIEEVANIGTHCIAYRMDVFNKIDPPYFQYSYNADHTKITDTEEIRCHRALYFAGVKLYVSWDHWADHIKLQRLTKPWIIDRKNVEDTYCRQIESLCREKANPSGDNPTGV